MKTPDLVRDDWKLWPRRKKMTQRVASQLAYRVAALRLVVALPAFIVEYS